MIFDDQIFSYNGKEYSSDEAHVLYMIGMKQYFPNLVFCSRLFPTSNSECYLIPEEIKICPLPYYKNVFELYLKSIFLLPKIWNQIKLNAKSWDIMCLSWPNPISMLIIILAKIKYPEKLIVLLIRQNLVELVRLRYNGVKKVIGLLMVKLLEKLLKVFGKKTVIFPLSNEVYQKYIKSFDNVHLTRLPPLSRRDIEKSKLRQSAQAKDTWQLLYVGRLEPEKALHNLIKSLVLLNKQNKKFHLSIVGSGQEENKLQILAKEYQLQKQITFCGYIPYGESLFSLYNEADIFVLPSMSEGSPNVLMEAMAFGVPIIASNVGGIPEIIHHKENGLLVEAGSTQALGEAIDELTNNFELIHFFRERYKKEAHKYTMEAQQEKMLSIILNNI